MPKLVYRQIDIIQKAALHRSVGDQEKIQAQNDREYQLWNVGSHWLVGLVDK